MASGALATGASDATPPGGVLRPFQLARDLRGVVRLIERAFAGEDADDRLLPQEVLALQLAAPFLRAAGVLLPAARDLFAGFVWEQDGQIVGNVTLGRLGGDATRWMIGNVAVDPAYRRAGIARRLTTAALAEIERRGGRVTILDVRADNAAAYALYRSLGFMRIDQTLELRRPELRAPQSGPSCIRPLRAREWRALAALLDAAAPDLVRRFTPVQEQQVMATTLAASLGIVGRLLTGVQSTILVAERNGRLAGAAEIEIRGRGTAHRLKLTIHPAARGTVEEDLVAGALAFLPTGTVRADVRASESAAEAALFRAGFTAVRTLDRLAYAHPS
ncbi:MAG: GNAT family N-acetyltransferase [Chloroflexota bacterium]|nr:GNAT family N-acetyltransferase [Dehalococcoidia bacterium]MDW8252977.1 GNAT family N-acetyltransferase [Chloroflexota bacterium]